MLLWAEKQGWAKLSASLFDGGRSAHSHWSNKLTCADLRSDHMTSPAVASPNQLTCAGLELAPPWPPLTAP